MKKVNEKNNDFLMKICGFCDTIAVFDHARLVESGTHTALLAADGQYAALWNAQAKYYE